MNKSCSSFRCGNRARLAQFLTPHGQRNKSETRRKVERSWCRSFSLNNWGRSVCRVINAPVNGSLLKLPERWLMPRNRTRPRRHRRRRFVYLIGLSLATDFPRYAFFIFFFYFLFRLFSFGKSQTETVQLRDAIYHVEKLTGPNPL